MINKSADAPGPQFQAGEYKLLAQSVKLQVAGTHLKQDVNKLVILMGLLK